MIGEKTDWKAVRVDCGDLPCVLDKLQAVRCRIVEVWKRGTDAVVLYRDPGHYPYGRDPLAGVMTK